MDAKHKQLKRSASNRMIAGLCAGIGTYFDVDPTIVRLLFVLGFFATGTGIAWVYLIMALVIPLEEIA